MIEKYYEISKLINLTKSYVFFNFRTSWRANINSILINENENKTYYLVKECRSESISENPFLYSGKYEFLNIVEKDRNNYFIRTSLISSKGTIKKASLEGIKVIEELSNIKILSPNEVFETLLKKDKKDIFCKIYFEFNKTNFSITTKCEYINFADKGIVGKLCKDCESKNNCHIIQPIMGYVPFILNGNIHVSYVARYSCKKKDGNLEFILRVSSPIFDYKSNAFIRNIIKFILNKLLFFTKKNEFQKRISIKKSNIVYFNYC